MTTATYLYYLAEDGIQSAKGATVDLAADNFEDKYGHEPDRVLGVKSEKDGVIESEIVWDNEE